MEALSKLYSKAFIFIISSGIYNGWYGIYNGSEEKNMEKLYLFYKKKRKEKERELISLVCSPFEPLR